MSASTSSPGESVRPHFRVGRELGSGASGRVFHGVLTQGFGPYPAGCELAIKYLHAEREHDANAAAAFDAEAAAGRAVLHPGIAHVIHAGRDARGRYLLMPFVAGRNLREVARESGALPEPLVRGIARQISGGLAALHAAGFVHGDIKPENVRLDAEGNAVLIDLGFARATSASDEPGSAARAIGSRPGSLAYVSPEQARGEIGSPASDVFALCVVIYELATGVHPFGGFASSARSARAGSGAHAVSRAQPAHTLLESGGSSGWISRQAIETPDADRLVAAIASARAAPASRFVPQISPFLDRVLADGLQRDPARRPDTSEMHRRFVDQESGAWWRSEIEFEAGARRGGSGERDAQHRTPLVGRDRELAVLYGAYDAATSEARAIVDRDARTPADRPAARGGVVWIRGASGLGKSRLVNEFASRARTRVDPPLYLYGRCRELDEERPCQPILRLLERYLRLPTGVPPGAREREILDKLVPPRVAETLTRVLDPSYEGSIPLSVLVALSVWIAALGKREPLVIFLDDVNWAGEDTLNVLSLVAEKLGDTRLLLVLGSRSDAETRSSRSLARLRERFAARVATWDIELAPLDEAAFEALVNGIFHHSAPRLRLASVLWQRSRGNPGLLSEILRGLVARGDARPHPTENGLVLAISPDELPLPGSLKKAISESYKRLPPRDRAWLRRLAVVGGRIDTDFLLRAFREEKRADLDATLARLVRSGWLSPVGARYRFTRPALRDAVYRSLSREQRVRIHAAAAEALRPEIGQHLSLGDAFQIAFHLRAAEDHTTFVRLLKPLLARLLKAGQPQRVHPLALWGLAAIDELPRSRDTDRMRIELLEAAVDAADRLGFRRGQRELLDRLADLEFDPDVDAEAVGRVYLLHGRYAVSTGQYGLARGMLRNAVDMFERSGNSLEHSEALRRLALVQGHVGELRDARLLAKRALEKSQLDPQRALARLALATVDVLEDRVESALRHTDVALSLVKRDSTFHLPGVFAAAYMLRARVYRSAGSPARALASASRAVRLARVAGERRLEAEATARLGGMLLDLDRAEEAEARLREALLLAEEIEDRRGQALARLFLGVLLWENADREASAMLARAAELAVEMGLNRVEAVSLAIHARIDREAGDVDAALRSVERAVQLLKKYGAELGDRIVILGTQALVLRSAKRLGEAATLERRLRDRLRRDSARIRSPLLRLRHGRAALRLLEAVLSPDGPVYPRARRER
jgi:serine/threonine protein kinase/tetratricopeptide (TPR) repeat protein